MTLPTPRGLQPVSLEDARERRRETRFIEEWVRRVLRTYQVDPSHLDELRAAGMVGGARGMREWWALPVEERTEGRRSAFVARGVVDEASTYVRQLHGRAGGKRATALQAATFDPGDHASVEERFHGFYGHLNHHLYAGLLHGTLGLESPEDVYIKREQQDLDRDKVEYALARLEGDDERRFANELLIEERPLKQAAGAVGIHERSKRLRERDKLFKKIRQHVIVFASSVAPRRKPGGGGDDPR